MNRAPFLTLAMLAAACGGTEEIEPMEELEQPFTSAEATLLDLEFDGELLTSTSYDARGKVEAQLLFTIGHLNGSRGVARLDKLEVTKLVSTLVSGKYKVTYHAKLPVAWGSKTNLPTTYALKLPRNVDASGITAFTTKYKSACADPEGHELSADNMFYYYRPNLAGCVLADLDAMKATARATVSTQNTTGKFPEYHKVWADSSLDVVAIFGKYDDGATTTSDAGIAAYNAFVQKIRAELPGSVTTPASVGTAPGVSKPDITISATLADGKKVKVTALLVDNVRTAPASFYTRYESLSPGADMIFYNGHAGLGANVRALASRGRFVAGKYLMLFMNGCDTFAYVDGALAQKRAPLNPDDPTGTKYMDIITSGMPAFFSSMPNASMALIRGLLKHAAPMTYEQIFAGIDRDQVVTVTGEEDNVYAPPASGPFTGMNEMGDVSQNEELRYLTPELAPGKYVVKLAHDPANPGGDADLYVRAGSQPTLALYDCRPYTGTSNEECTITLAARQRIYISIFGYAAVSHYLLTVRAATVAPAAWAGLDASATVLKDVEKRWETPSLAAGRYVFEITGSGDADLYVRAGSAPTTALYDCRPYTGTSNERCVVTLSAAARVHVLVRGYAATSTVRLVGKPE